MPWSRDEEQVASFYTWNINCGNDGKSVSTNLRRRILLPRASVRLCPLYRQDAFGPLKVSSVPQMQARGSVTDSCRHLANTLFRNSLSLAFTLQSAQRGASRQIASLVPRYWGGVEGLTKDMTAFVFSDTDLEA